MADKQTLEQLIRLARTRSDSAARALGSVRTREREEHGKLELLINYRKEYRARFEQAASAGLDRRGLNDYREFMLQLEEAIHQQTEFLAQHRRAVEKCRTDWQSANGKLKGFDTLQERHREAQRLSERRREQRGQDEQAARGRTKTD